LAPVFSAATFVASMIYWSVGCGETLRNDVSSDFMLDVGFYLTLGAFVVMAFVGLFQTVVEKSTADQHIVTTRNKRLHLCSILLCYVGLVLSITAVSNDTVAWSKQSGILTDENGTQNTIISVGLLAGEICYGGLADWSSTAPSQCVDGGMAVVGLSGAAVVMMAGSFALVFYRAHSFDTLVKKTAAVFFLLIACLFQVLPFCLWKYGCHHQLQQYDGGISLDIGYTLSVLSFVFVLLGFVMQGIARHKTVVLHGDQNLPGQIQQVPTSQPDSPTGDGPTSTGDQPTSTASPPNEPQQIEGYARLADSDVPYL